MDYEQLRIENEEIEAIMNYEKEKIVEIKEMEEYMNYKRIILNFQFSILN
jgi:hypothetical protein